MAILCKRYLKHKEQEASLENEMQALRLENKALRLENKDLRLENKELRGENLKKYSQTSGIK